MGQAVGPAPEGGMWIGWLLAGPQPVGKGAYGLVRWPLPRGHFFTHLITLDIPDCDASIKQVSLAEGCSRGAAAALPARRDPVMPCGNA